MKMMKGCGAAYDQVSGSACVYIPLDPKTMKNEGFTPPIYGL